jgi:hypothetical protein
MRYKTYASNYHPDLVKQHGATIIYALYGKGEWQLAMTFHNVDKLDPAYDNIWVGWFHYIGGKYVKRNHIRLAECTFGGWRMIP